MKSIMRLIVLALALAVVVVAGCSTPASRIKKNPELFASFPPTVQKNLMKGKIDIGYTKNMVFIALGKADREYTRTTASGLTEVWSYTDTYSTMDRQKIDGSFRVRDSSGTYQTIHDSVWVDVQQMHEYEMLRIEFENGVVRAIEELNW